MPACAVVNGMPAAAASRAQALEQRSRARDYRRVKPRLRDGAQRGQPCRHRHRVARQRPGLVDRAAWRYLGHDVGASAEGADRHAAADHLAERRQVRRDAEVRLCPAERNAEPGHDFVEDQHGSRVRAFLAQRFEKARQRQYAVHVSRDRLHDHARDLAARAREKLPDSFAVVVVEHDGVVGHIARYARRGGFAQRQRPRAGLDQQGVDVAVITALELDDLVATRVTACETDRAHGRFGARSSPCAPCPSRAPGRTAVPPSRPRVRSARRSSGRRASAARARPARPDGSAPGSAGPRSRRNQCSACRPHRTGTGLRRARRIPACRPRRGRREPANSRRRG